MTTFWRYHLPQDSFTSVSSCIIYSPHFIQQFPGWTVTFSNILSALLSKLSKLKAKTLKWSILPACFSLACASGIFKIHNRLKSLQITFSEFQKKGRRNYRELLEESLASLLKRCTVLKSGSLVWGKNYQRSLIEHTGLKVGIDIEDNKKE